MDLGFSPARVTIDDLVRVLWIQILDSGTGPTLLSSVSEREHHGCRTTVYSQPLGGGTRAAILVNHQLLPVAMRWDAARTEEGLVAVFERALGGRNAIVAEGPNAGGWISPRDALHHFTGPRFARGLAPRFAVTAIVDQASATLFPDILSASPTARPIGVACVDAILIVDRGGPSLVYKTRARGAPSEDEIPAGRIHHVRLSDDLAPTSAPTSLFPQTTVYEFDVTPYRDGFAAFATTPTGIVAAVAEFGASGSSVFGRLEERLREPAASPTILATPQGIHAAYLMSAGTPKARLFVGEIQIRG